MKRAALPVLLSTAVVLAATSQEPPVFRTTANLVVLHVNVFDKHHDPVPALTDRNFLIVEGDRAQSITFFSSEDVPVTAGLVIDNSSSMIPLHRMVVSGGMAFANSSHPADQLFAVSFTENVRLGLPPPLKFTASRPLLQATLNSMTPGGQTALYDAVIKALDHIELAAHQKRVLIVLSDGDDTASSHSRKEMLERARRSDVIIYTIGLNSHGGKSDTGVLKELARLGGALAYFPATEDEVVRDFGTIARNVRQGYSIGYVPTNGALDGTERRITVMMRVPGRTLEARYRHSYIAASSGDAPP